MYVSTLSLICHAFAWAAGWFSADALLPTHRQANFADALASMMILLSASELMRMKFGVEGQRLFVAGARSRLDRA